MIELTADIISAYVSNNSVTRDELLKLIASVYAALSGTTPTEAEPEKIAVAPRPAVPIKRSITDSHIICLEDGKKFKSLRRHLALLNLTPESYREKWGLPADYPMVAPAYSRQRAELAKRIGLGRKAGNRGRRRK